MKGAKELAEHCREAAERQFGYFGAEERRSVLSNIAAHLEAKAAIDSAVTGEVKRIQRLHDSELTRLGIAAGAAGACQNADRDRAALLAVVHRQAGEIAELRAHPPFSIDARLSVDLTIARAEVERLKSEKTALAAENARLVNEHAAAMSRADVLAEGVRHWRLSMRNGFATLATQNWELQHGHMVSK